jgi:hypothetical protein
MPSHERNEAIAQHPQFPNIQQIERDARGIRQENEYLKGMLREFSKKNNDMEKVPIFVFACPDSC